jgi:hypothetical protein
LISVLDGGAVEVTDANITGLSLLCSEVGLEGLVARL